MTSEGRRFAPEFEVELAIRDAYKKITRDNSVVAAEGWPEEPAHVVFKEMALAALFRLEEMGLGPSRDARQVFEWFTHRREHLQVTVVPHSEAGYFEVSLVIDKYPTLDEADMGAEAHDAILRDLLHDIDRERTET